jgi:hypothetical protein
MVGTRDPDLHVTRKAFFERLIGRLCRYSVRKKVWMNEASVKNDRREIIQFFNPPGRKTSS